MELPQLSQSQFRTFLLIYSAHVDYEYSEKEETYIKLHCSAKEYEDMHQLFLSQSEYSALKLIIKHKKIYLCDQQLRSQIYKDIINVFKVDGDYSRPEKAFLQFLDKIIESWSDEIN